MSAFISIVSITQKLKSTKISIFRWNIYIVNYYLKSLFFFYHNYTKSLTDYQNKKNVYVWFGFMAYQPL